MAKLADLLKMPGRTHKEIVRILGRIDGGKTPIRVEIENTNIRFVSILSVKRGLVVIAKPPGLAGGLHREGFVRFKLPGVDGRVLRLQITVPHFNLIGGSSVLLCSMPKAFAQSSPREAERYDTTRFKNLFLLLPKIKGLYRIIDISSSGCKVVIDQIRSIPGLETGSSMNPASITVGSKLSIDLQNAILRSQIKNTLGFQLEVGSSANAGKYLDHFLNSLEAAEIKRLQANVPNTSAE